MTNIFHKSKRHRQGSWFRPCLSGWRSQRYHCSRGHGFLYVTGTDPWQRRWQRQRHLECGDHALRDSDGQLPFYGWESLRFAKQDCYRSFAKTFSHESHAHDFEMFLEKASVKNRWTRYQFAGDFAADLTCTSSEAVLT